MYLKSVFENVANIIIVKTSNKLRYDSNNKLRYDSKLL